MSVLAKLEYHVTVETPTAVSVRARAAVDRLQVPDDAALLSWTELQRAVLRVHEVVAGWTELTGRVRARLRRHGVAIVRGLHFDDDDRLLVVLCAAIGRLIEPYRSKGTRVVMRIAAGTHGSSTETMHTDGAGWDRPNDVTILQCVQPDENGAGLLRLARVDDVLTAFASEQEVLDCLAAERTPFARDSEMGGGYFHAAVCRPASSLGPAALRYYAPAISEAIEVGAAWNATIKDAVGRFAEVVGHPGFGWAHLMTAGEWVAIDNRRLLHARTPVSTGSSRLIKRCKVNWPG